MPDPVTHPDLAVTADDAPPRLATASDPLKAVRALAARRFFVIGAVIAVVSALLATMLPREMEAGRRSLLIALFLAYGGLSLLAGRVRDAQVDLVTSALSVAAVGVVSGAAVLVGFGIGSPSLGFLGLLAMMSVAIAPPVAAVGVTLLSLLATAWVAWAESRGLTGAATAASSDLLLRLLQQWLLIAGGLAGGWMLARLVARHVLAADERERRFRGLLAVAADAYWELDEAYRVVALTRPGSQGGSAVPVDPAALGRHPWALPQLVMDDDTLDLLQTHLEARTAFRDLAVRWVGADGTLVHLVLSGEPRLRACEHLGKPRRRTTATRVVRA